MLLKAITKCLPVFLTLCASLALAGEKPRVAIIIDDLGYNYDLGKDAIELPGPVTYAVIPRTPNGVRLAQLAHHSEKEVILHIPMQSAHTHRLDAGGLTADMEKATFVETLRHDLESIPFIAGANNHMGSLLTEQTDKMTWLMHELKQRQMFFVDSKTSAKSVAGTVARQHEVPTRNRHVFLDNEREVHSINEQFNELLQKARKYGDAIAIGHPHRATTDYLRRAIPILEQAGIELVPVSRLMPGDGAILDSPVEEKREAEEQTMVAANDLPPEYWWAEKTSITNIERDSKATTNLMLSQIRDAESNLGKRYEDLKNFIKTRDLAMSKKWKAFKDEYKDGDVIWKYVGDYSNAHVIGYVLVRNGKAVTSVTLPSALSSNN